MITGHVGTADSSGVVDHELRLAIVMYGGVSLAIYINGVAQELQRLVRATANYVDVTQGQGNSVHEAKLAQVYREAASHVRPAAGVVGAGGRTRVVIDILAGTSAGGINAIFLAKALSRGQPMAALRKLWVTEGEVAKLVNDDQSRTEHLARDALPPSLFNGDRMYEKLIEAFRTMGGPPSGALADDLDLFVTLTDLQGFDVRLPLHDRKKQVHERRHRTVIHFRTDRAQGRDDFQTEFDPLLAFAARSTSSIPFVFAPSQLQAAAKHAERMVGAEDGSPVGRLDAWSRFFPDYRTLQQPAAGTGAPASEREHVQRRFDDGGVLNNKPFDYAVQALVIRRSATSVTRKLFFVEPSPDHLGAEARQAMGLDPFTVGLEGLSLPRHETIRDDLERIHHRNRQVDRLRTLTKGAAEDREVGAVGLFEPISRDDFASARLGDLVALSGLGAGYGGHHRLKVAQVTDDVARIFGRLAGVGESDEQIAMLRDTVVQLWREDGYEREQSDKGLQSEAAFLLAYDLAYRLRRLHFMLEWVDEWLARRSELLKLVAEGSEPSDPRIGTMRTTVTRVWKAVGVRRTQGAGLLSEPAFEGGLRDLRNDLGAVLTQLQSDVAALHLQAESPSVSGDDASGMRKQRENLKELAARTFAQVANPDQEAADRVAAFGVFAKELAVLITTITTHASTTCADLFNPARDRVDTAATKPEQAAHLARAVVAYAYWDFERFDMVRFPVMTLAGIGDELAKVEVHRISPRDATSLVDEARSGSRKLAGTAISNFGAFFDVRWREADIVWGRLDAAELLIGAMVPEGEERACLIQQAHKTILASEERTTEEMEASVAARPQLDRRTVATTAGRASRVLGRLLDDFRRQQRPRLPFLLQTRSVALTLGTIVTAMVAVAIPTSFANLVGRHAATLLGIVFSIVFAIGLVTGQPGWRYYGVVGLGIVGLWSLTTWSFGTWLERRPLDIVIRIGLDLLKLLLVVLLVASLVVGALEIATALGLPAASLVERNRAIAALLRAQPTAIVSVLVGMALLVLGVASARFLARHEERPAEVNATALRRVARVARVALLALVVASFGGAVWFFRVAVVLAGG